ncbi:MAG: thiamine pyrophosphate-dependent dehydrogenase E1 component subunit alpha [Candidatus Binatia bacterium]|jgi:TPP-dependent pyruvate/acetoin dehydrogenase alpha subunit
MHEMLRIRLFEERVLDEFSKGRLFGTTHTCIGQEADAVGVIGALRRSDIVVSNHRGHGHYLAHGGSMHALAAELMGRSTGVSGGRGGSQHLHFPGFYSNGIQGGIVPCAVGMALAEKRQNSGVIVAVFLGDGTFGEGVVYESFNIASLWRVPVLFVVENNRYAQTTPLSANFSGDFCLRFKAFDIDIDELDTTDVVVIREAAESVVASVREMGGPRAMLLNTYRFSPHSKGDDVRDPAEIEHYRQFDPIVLMRARLSDGEYDSSLTAARDEICQAFGQAEMDAWPDPADLLDAREELLKPWVRSSKL